jgi:hypothetical protein
MRKRLLLGTAIVIAATVLVVRFLHVAELIHIGAGYTAEQTCACVFVSHRSSESCRGDLEPMARFFVSVTLGPDEVTSRSFFMSRATAHYEKTFGCTLED